jgi:GMP synthase (glutamine-hydrolysing)
VKTAVAIRHVPFEGLGSFAPVLSEHGYKVRYLDAATDNLGPVVSDPPEILIVLGGPIGAYELRNYPFLLLEQEIIKRRFQENLATIGVCLGAQLIAAAAGALVYPAATKELGWEPVSMTVPGEVSCLTPITGTPVLHWHGDTFDLPEGAVRLASTKACQNQAFQLERSLGLQFHVEVTGRGLEAWFVGHATEIAATDGVTVEGLRADTRRNVSALEAAGPSCLEHWLDEIA